MSNEGGVYVLQSLDDHGFGNIPTGIPKHNPRSIRVFAWGDYEWFRDNPDSRLNQINKELNNRLDEIKTKKADVEYVAQKADVSWVSSIEHSKADKSDLESLRALILTGGKLDEVFRKITDEHLARIDEKSNIIQGLSDQVQRNKDSSESARNYAEKAFRDVRNEIEKSVSAVEEAKNSVKDANLAKEQAQEICKSLESRSKHIEASIKDAEKRRENLENQINEYKKDIEKLARILPPAEAGFISRLKWLFLGS
jgi:chromosome segregation ATPase